MNTHVGWLCFFQIVRIKTFESGGRIQALVEFKDAATATNALVLSHNSLLMGRNIWVVYSKNKLMQAPDADSLSGGWVEATTTTTSFI